MTYESHILNNCNYACVLCHFSHVQLFATLGTVGHQASLSTGLSKNTGVSCHTLLKGISPTQGLNLCLWCLQHCRQILYPLSHLGSTVVIIGDIY